MSDHDRGTPPVPDESILPPAPQLSAKMKAAVVAGVITGVLSVVGLFLSFWLAHGAGLIVRTVFVLVAWPALGVMFVLSSTGLPDLFYIPLLLAAEWAYVWGLILVAMNLASRRKAARGTIVKE